MCTHWNSFNSATRKPSKNRIAKLLVKAAEKLTRYLPAVEEQRTREDDNGDGDGDKVPAQPHATKTDCLQDSMFVCLD